MWLPFAVMTPFPSAADRMMMFLTHPSSLRNHRSRRRGASVSFTGSTFEGCACTSLGSYSPPVSYDLYAISVRPGDDPANAFEVLMAADEDEATSWTDDQVVRAEQLAASLQALNPRLERFVFDYAEIAKNLGVTEAEARARWRHIELRRGQPDPGDDSGGSRFSNRALLVHRRSGPGHYARSIELSGRP